MIENTIKYMNKPNTLLYISETTDSLEPVVSLIFNLMECYFLMLSLWKRRDSNSRPNARPACRLRS